MIQKIFLAILVVVFVSTSCVSTLPKDYTGISNSMMNIDAKMKDVVLGMTMDEVIRVAGTFYEVVEASESVTVLGYKSYDYGIYKLRFIDGKLKEWKKEWLPRYDDYLSSSYNSSSKKGVKDNSSTKAHLNAHRNSLLSTATSDSQKAAINAHMDAHEKAVLGQ